MARPATGSFSPEPLAQPEVKRTGEWQQWGADQKWYEQVWVQDLSGTSRSGRFADWYTQEQLDALWHPHYETWKAQQESMAAAERAAWAEDNRDLAKQQASEKAWDGYQAAAKAATALPKAASGGGFAGPPPPAWKQNPWPDESGKNWYWNKHAGAADSGGYVGSDGEDCPEGVSWGF